jgi:hypothetical protein
MKYLKTIFEWSQTSPRRAESDYSTLSREELLALADSAIAEEDFALLKEINDALSKKGESSGSYLKTYEAWSPILESVQDAKKELQKLADAEFASRRGELSQEYAEATPEERRERISAVRQEIQDSYLKHPDFLEIQKLMHKSPNYIGMFVKFRFLQGANMAQIQDLARGFIENKDQLKTIPLEKYANQMPDESGINSGFEKLGDEFRRLSQNRRGRWIVDALLTKAMSSDFYASRGYGPSNPVNQKDLYRNASPEKQEELLTAARQLNDLNKPGFIQGVRKALGACDSIEKIIEVVKTKLKISDTDRGNLEMEAISKYPSVAILYSGPDHLVLSFRNDVHLPDLCPGAKAFCINPTWAKGSNLFWNYAKGALQLIILDYTVDTSSPFHTVGVTVAKDKSVKQLCDSQNQPCIIGPDYRSLLLDFTTQRGNHAYPQDLVDAIEQNWDSEFSIKLTTDEFYQEFSKFGSNERDREAAMVARLEGVVQNFGDIKGRIQRGQVSKEEMSASSKTNIADQILAQELSNFKTSPVIINLRKDTVHKATEKGLHSPAEVKMFELILKDTPELKSSTVDIIITINSRIFQQLESNLKNAKLNIKQKEFFDAILAGLKNATEYLHTIKSSLEK